MKVLVNDGIYAPKVMDLERALQPTPNHCGESVGAVEQARDQAELNAVAIGRLLAWFVESEAMTLDTAKFIASVTEDISEAPPEPEPPKHDDKWHRRAGGSYEQERYRMMPDRIAACGGKPESVKERLNRLQRDSDELSWMKNPDRNGS